MSLFLHVLVCRILYILPRLVSFVLLCLCLDVSILHYTFSRFFEIKSFNSAGSFHHFLVSCVSLCVTSHDFIFLSLKCLYFCVSVCVGKGCSNSMYVCM